MFKTVYQIDSETKEYKGQAIAHINPMFGVNGDDQEFNIPAGCVDVEPSEFKEGFSQVFNEDKKCFEYIEDNRGEIYNTTDYSMIIFNELGKIKDGFTKLKPEPFQKWDGKKWVDDAIAKTEFEKTQNNNQIFAELQMIDIKTVRSLREWVKTQIIDIPEKDQTDFHKAIIQHEKEANEKRVNLIK